MVEFCCFTDSFRSRSEICSSASASFCRMSSNCRRSCSFSSRKRSGSGFARRSCFGGRCGGVIASKHLGSQMFQPLSTRIPTPRPSAPELLRFALLLWAIRTFTSLGLRLDIVGKNERAAIYAKYPIRQYQVIVLISAGALAGIAGWAQVAAIEGRLRPSLSPGYGFTGFLVSWIARHNPLFAIWASVFFAALITGCDSLQLTQHLPFATVNILQGLTLLALLLVRRVSPTIQGKASARPPYA